MVVFNVVNVKFVKEVVSFFYVSYLTNIKYYIYLKQFYFSIPFFFFSSFCFTYN